MITKTNKLKFTTMTWTMLLMLSGHLAKASRDFAEPVSYKDITEAMRKAVQSIEGTTRQY